MSKSKKKIFEKYYKGIGEKFNHYSPTDKELMFIFAVFFFFWKKLTKAPRTIEEIKPADLELTQNWLSDKVAWRTNYNWTHQVNRIKKLATEDKPLIVKTIERRAGKGGIGNVVTIGEKVAKAIDIIYNGLVDTLSTKMVEDYNANKFEFRDFTERFTTPGTQEYSNVTRKKARGLSDDLIDYIKKLPDHLKYTLYIYHRENPYRYVPVIGDDSPLEPLKDIRLDVLFANPKIYRTCENGFNVYNQDVHKTRFGIKVPIRQDDHNINKLHQWSIIRKLQIGSKEVINAIKTNINDFIAKITSMFKCWKFRGCKDPPNYSQCETCREYRPDLSGLQI